MASSPQVPLLLLLFACHSPLPDLGGQSGTDQSVLPGTCQEISRTEVGLDDTPTDFGETPREVIASAIGTWAGAWESPSETETASEATMTLAYASGIVELVDEEYQAPSDDDDVAGGADAASCAPHYEISIGGTFVASTAGLDEAFDLTLEAEGGSSPTFAVYLPLSAVGGTARPTQWDASSLGTELILQATLGASGADGSAWWVTTGSPDVPTETHEIDWYEMGELVGTFSLDVQ